MALDCDVPANDTDFASIPESERFRFVYPLSSDCLSLDPLWSFEPDRCSEAFLQQLLTDRTGDILNLNRSYSWTSDHCRYPVSREGLLLPELSARFHTQSDL